MTQETDRDLRESVDLETRADLLAVSGNFGEAALLMQQANKIRRARFGPYDPNRLRDLTMALLGGTQ